MNKLNFFFFGKRLNCSSFDCKIDFVFRIVQQMKMRLVRWARDQLRSECEALTD